MSSPFVGQIEIFGFTFPPKNWAPCNGQILGIQQNQALFALLGTTYGGNGTTTFGLPDLRGRLPLGFGTDFSRVTWQLGQVGGSESITLTNNQIPKHIHSMRASSGADLTTSTNTPDPSVGLGQTSGSIADGTALKVPAWVADAAPAAVLGPTALSQGAAAQPHENRMPLLALNICICLYGVFPSRN